MTEKLSARWGVFDALGLGTPIGLERNFERLASQKHGRTRPETGGIVNRTFGEVPRAGQQRASRRDVVSVIGTP